MGALHGAKRVSTNGVNICNLATNMLKRTNHYVIVHTDRVSLFQQKTSIVASETQIDVIIIFIDLIARLLRITRFHTYRVLHQHCIKYTDKARKLQTKL